MSDDPTTGPAPTEQGPGRPGGAPRPASATPRRDAMRSRVDPLARAIAARGISANGVTLIGFGIACLAGLAGALEWWIICGLVGMFGAAFDMLDGAVARVTGTTGRLGAFMDATFDRWGEAVGYVGIVIGCTRAGFDVGAWLAAMAMASAFLVSYARARAESQGFSPGKGMAAVGLAPREVRTVILGVGLVLAGLLGGIAPPDPGTTGNLVLALALALITVLATVTVIQRVRSVVQQSAADAGDR